MEKQLLLHPYKNQNIMKILKRTFYALALLMISMATAHAQTTKKEKEAAKEAEFKKVLESKNFTFTAQIANPSRGGASRNLTSEYDVRITPDSIISYLPFFGRAYVATMNPDDAGIKFISTKFTYTATLRKNGYDITIKPTDTKDVRLINLSASFNGYGILNVTSQNRDPISFYGTLEANKKPKK
jgi:hypothetical protein